MVLSRSVAITASTSKSGHAAALGRFPSVAHARLGASAPTTASPSSRSSTPVHGADRGDGADVGEVRHYYLCAELARSAPRPPRGDDRHRGQRRPVLPAQQGLGHTSGHRKLREATASCGRSWTGKGGVTWENTGPSGRTGTPAEVPRRSSNPTATALCSRPSGHPRRAESAPRCTSRVCSVDDEAHSHRARSSPPPVSARTALRGIGPEPVAGQPPQRPPALRHRC